MERVPTKHEAAFLSIVRYIYDITENKPYIAPDDENKFEMLLGNIGMGSLAIGITLALMEPEIATKIVMEYATAIAEEQNSDIITLSEGFLDCAEMIVDGDRIW